MGGPGTGAGVKSLFSLHSRPDGWKMGIFTVIVGFLVAFHVQLLPYL